VVNVRNGLANRLPMVNPCTGNSLYESTGNGALAEIGKMDPDYSIIAYQRMLRSSEMLSYPMLIVLEKVLNKNIFVLDENTQDVYARDGWESLPERDCVVMIYSYPQPDCGHFDMISIVNPQTGIEVSHYKHNNPFIRHLIERLKVVGR
jgi:hypothetical protein